MTKQEKKVDYVTFHDRLFYLQPQTNWFIDFVLGRVDCAEPAGHLTHEPRYSGLSRLARGLSQRHPDIGLSFGYVGNVGKGYGTFADLQWYFFTKVWDYRDGRMYDNCHSRVIGLTAKMEQIERAGDFSSLSNDLSIWIKFTVSPDLGKPCNRSER